MNQLVFSICEKIENIKAKYIPLHAICLVVLDYISTFPSLKIQFISSNPRANYLFLNLIGNTRSITTSELEFYQFIQKKKNVISFQTCFLCKRVQVIRIKNKKICPFLHIFQPNFTKKYFKCEQLFSSLEKRKGEKNTLEYFFPNTYPTKLKISYDIKKVFFQKEFNWKTISGFFVCLKNFL